MRGFLFFLVYYFSVWSLEFPLREKYSGLSFLDTQALFSQIESTLVVDVRSPFEYKIIHIQNALNLPIANKSFLSSLKESIKVSTSTSHVVFYCNGITCEKSYEAAQIAHKEGIVNVHVYDSGPFEWLKSYPQKTFFLDSLPADPTRVISKEHLFEKLLLKDDFLTVKENIVFIDVREPYQRKFVPAIKGLKNIPLERMEELLKVDKFKGKSLRIFDAVGKQVQWLQYKLEQYGYKDYAFLQGGVKSLE